MKRLLAIGLGAIALMLAGIAAPTPAMASTTCQAVNSLSGYPNGAYSFICGTATQTDANTMVSAAPRSGTQKNERWRAGMKYYIFGTAAEYTDYAQTQGKLPYVNPGSAHYVTAFDTNNVPLYVAIFPTNGSDTNTNIALHTMRGTGQAMNYLIGYVTVNGVQAPTNIQASNQLLPNGTTTSDYATYLAKDWTTVNAMSACTATGGLFHGRQDANGQYICNGTNGTGTALSSSPTNYAALSGCSTQSSPCNENVLETAYPAVYNSGNAALWVDQYSTTNGGSDDNPASLKSADHYLGNFTCTHDYNNFINQNGRQPTSNDGSEWSTGGTCGTPVVSTVCTKLFGVSDFADWPSGNVFNCEGNTTKPGQIQSGLDGLGGSNTYSAIEQAVNSARANVYVFLSGTAYTNAFTAAGQTPGSPSGNLAITYPNGSMYYSILFDTTPPNFTAQEWTYDATHELGHTVDDTAISNQQSALSAFDTAMQNDWVALDYLPGTQTALNPCAKKTIDGYNGPLQGATDPSNGLPFCTGTNGNQVESKWAGKLTSDILRDPSVDGKVDSTTHCPLGVMLYQTCTGTLGGNPGYPLSQGWREWYAEALAIQAVSDEASTSIKPELGQAVANGYFACTAGASSGWLHQVYTTPGTVPTPPLSCQSGNLPAWWVTLH